MMKSQPLNKGASAPFSFSGRREKMNQAEPNGGNLKA
jgi:hypothetical protein